MTNHRPFKFRIWNTYQKKFYSPKEFAIRGDGLYLLLDRHDDGIMEWQHDCWNNQEQGLRVLQQFTGLLDSTGKEIYEGDIMDCHYLDENVIGEIKYSEEYSAFLIGENALWQGWLGKSKIIGNIFETPELLQSCSKN